MAMFGALARPKSIFGPPFDPVIQENPQVPPIAGRGTGQLMLPGNDASGLSSILQQALQPQPDAGILMNAINAHQQGAGGAHAFAQQPAPAPAPAQVPGGMFAGATSAAVAPTQGQQLLAPQTPHHKPKFFDKDGAWRDVVGTLGDVLAGAGGGQGMYWNTKIRQRQQQAEWAREEAKRHQDRSWQVEDRDFQANRPQYFMSGHDRVVLDPVTGESKMVYDGPEDYQTYAETMGLDPEDDGYGDAVQDYVLRGNGPTSQAARRMLEGVRQQNRLHLRATPTYAQAHPTPKAPRRSAGGSGVPRTMSAVVAPIIAKVARGEKLTPAEMQAYSMYRPGRGGGSSPKPAGGGPTATDPKTGRKVQWNGSAWVPAS